jgi:hypothetical protein
VLVLFYSLLAAMNLGAVFAYQAQALQGARTLKFAESLADPPPGGANRVHPTAFENGLRTALHAGRPLARGVTVKQPSFAADNILARHSN